MATSNHHKAPDELLEQIARDELNITTLETRHNDTNDFHTMAVWEIKTILQRAYQAGREDSR